MAKSNFKKIVMTSFQWRHHHYITEKHHQYNVTNFFQFEPFQSKFLATPVNVMHKI